MARSKTMESVVVDRELTIKECDLCHVKTEPGRDWPSRCSPNKHAHYYTREETEIECILGDMYPESEDDRERIFLDICPKCFVEKFIPGVEEKFGIKFNRRNGY